MLKMGGAILIFGHILLPERKKYRIISSKGIPRKPKKYYFNSVGEILEFSLIFPSIPQDVDMINLIEGPKSEWQFFGIHLK